MQPAAVRDGAASGRRKWRMPPSSQRGAKGGSPERGRPITLPGRPQAVAGSQAWPMTSIDVHGLTKDYGATRAVDQLTFSVRPGRVTGFLGPNGAGKSTTMRLVLGLDRPTAGSATLGGVPYASLENPLRRVGVLLDAQAAHGSRTARDHLLALAVSNGISRHQGGRGPGGHRARSGRETEDQDVLPRHAATSRNRGGAARRAGCSDAGRAVERAGSGRHHLDP